MTPPIWIDPEAWRGFCEMRRAMPKIPFTERAQKMIITELEKLRAAGYDPDKCLDQSVLHGWRDVYATRDKSIKPVDNSAADETRAYLKAQSEIRPNAQIARAALSAVRRVK